LDEVTKGWSMKVRVDAERCQGHGVCVGTAPQLFAFDDAGEKAVVLLDRVQATPDIDGARAAEASCPELAIFVEEA